MDSASMMSCINNKPMALSWDHPSSRPFTPRPGPSPLGPALANILLDIRSLNYTVNFLNPISMYYRYMDDTFVVCGNKRECALFLEKLNSLHLSQFIFLKERYEYLPFQIFVKLCKFAPVLSKKNINLN